MCDEDACVINLSRLEREADAALEAAIFVMMEIPSDWAGSAGESRARDVRLLPPKGGETRPLRQRFMS